MSDHGHRVVTWTDDDGIRHHESRTRWGGANSHIDLRVAFDPSDTAEALRVFDNLTAQHRAAIEAAG